MHLLGEGDCQSVFPLIVLKCVSSFVALKVVFLGGAYSVSSQCDSSEEFSLLDGLKSVCLLVRTSDPPPGSKNTCVPNPGSQLSHYAGVQGGLR